MSFPSRRCTMRFDDELPACHAKVRRSTLAPHARAGVPAREFIGRRLFIVIMGVVLTIGLASCGAVRQEVTIGRGERWQVEYRAYISPTELMMIGDTSEMERQFDELRNTDRNFRWSKEAGKDGGLTYVLKSSGTGFDILASNAFDDHATFSPLSYQGKDAVQFTFNSFAAFGDMGYYELVLRTGEVLETNGELLEKGTVRWVGARRVMEAVFRPSVGIDPGLLIGLAAVVLVIGVAFVLLRSWQRQRHMQTVMAGAATYCHQCGAKIETAGKFCPSCGAPRL